jgi:hypothetical protein
MERANSCPSFFELFKTAPGTGKQDPEQTEPGRLDRQGLKWGNFPRSSTAGVTAGERRKRSYAKLVRRLKVNPRGYPNSNERIGDASQSTSSQAIPQAASAAQTSQAATTSFVLRK